MGHRDTYLLCSVPLKGATLYPLNLIRSPSRRAGMGNSTAVLFDLPLDGHSRFTDVLAVGSAYFVRIGGALSGPSERATVTRIAATRLRKDRVLLLVPAYDASEERTNQSSLVAGTYANGLSPPNDIDVASIDASWSRLYMVSHALSVAAVQPAVATRPVTAPVKANTSAYELRGKTLTILPEQYMVTALTSALAVAPTQSTERARICERDGCMTDVEPGSLQSDLLSERSVKSAIARSTSDGRGSQLLKTEVNPWHVCISATAPESSISPWPVLCYGVNPPSIYE
ncbi:hypothetical protein An08g07660 [Aspergillus niger]|uniref:Uncharacterized protein n=2 Tax=Aspergillus niger TaxID=5061 RepID=A2QRY7_ASPNC|nr:hypothetical protein An08g07660 [Aspergillus niger]CAL00784.1 hypothetical protein An08g07660 [Aspergillus niger]